MLSETQRIIAPVALELLGFAMYIFTDRLLTLGILCILKSFLVFYRSTQPTGSFSFKKILGFMPLFATPVRL